MAQPTTQQRRRKLFAREARQVGSFAMIQPNRAKINTPANLKTVSEGGGQRVARVAETWADDAYYYADSIGEVGFVINLTANTGARCELRVQKWNPETKAWEETDDERAERVMDAFVGPTGGQTELKRRALLHLSIAGESTLTGTPTEELGQSYGIFWEFLSSRELSVVRGQKPKRRRDGMAGEELDDDVYIARLWRSHPQYSDMADSALRRVLQICQEVSRLTQLVDAITASRLATGILYVDERLTFSKADDDEEADTELIENGIDIFTKMLMDHLSAPVKDRMSAASLVPLIIRGPHTIEKPFQLFDLAKSLDTWAQNLRSEALDRLNKGMDIDPSLIEGKAEINHWGTYNVDADFATKHVLPAVELLADFVTHAYFRPMMEEFEDCTPEEVLNFRVVADPSPIMARTDEAASARVLHDQMVLSDETLVRANGFDEADMPGDEEFARRLALRLLLSQPSFAPALAEFLGLAGIDWSKTADPGTNVGGTAPGAGALPAPPGFAPRDNLTPPDQSSAALGPPASGQPAFTLVDRLAVAADAAVERAVERANSRFVTKARRPKEAKARLATVTDRASALTAIAPSELTEMGLTPEVLLDGAWDAFALKTRGWVRAHLESQGRSPLVADDLAALAISGLCEALSVYVTENLHRPMPLMSSGLRIPERLVIQSLASAGVL